jgi:hypothetical protein
VPENVLSFRPNISTLPSERSVSPSRPSKLLAVNCASCTHISQTALRSLDSPTPISLADKWQWALLMHPGLMKAYENTIDALMARAAVKGKLDEERPAIR